MNIADHRGIMNLLSVYSRLRKVFPEADPGGSKGRRSRNYYTGSTPGKHKGPGKYPGFYSRRSDPSSQYQRGEKC